MLKRFVHKFLGVSSPLRHPNYIDLFCSIGVESNQTDRTSRVNKSNQTEFKRTESTQSGVVECLRRCRPHCRRVAVDGDVSAVCCVCFKDVSVMF